MYGSVWALAWHFAEEGKCSTMNEDWNRRTGVQIPGFLAGPEWGALSTGYKVRFSSSVALLKDIIGSRERLEG
jgi:hypothetical protein